MNNLNPNTQSPVNSRVMTDTQMLKSLINASERMFEAKAKYEKHPGGGASQKIKNKLAKELNISYQELNNLTFNLKQLIK